MIRTWRKTSPCHVKSWSHCGRATFGPWPKSQSPTHYAAEAGNLRCLRNLPTSGAWFRSTDLWVMGPHASHCATPLQKVKNCVVIQMFRPTRTTRVRPAPAEGSFLATSSRTSCTCAAQTHRLRCACPPCRGRMCGGRPGATRLPCCRCAGLPDPLGVVVVGAARPYCRWGGP